MIKSSALSSNVDKRLQTFDKVATFPQGTNLFKLCENEMLSVRKAKETFEILSKECENELYVIYNIYLHYMRTKCAREIKKYVNFGAKKKCNAQMINLEDYFNENKTEHNRTWP